MDAAVPQRQPFFLFIWKRNAARNCFPTVQRVKDTPIRVILFLLGKVCKTISQLQTIGAIGGQGPGHARVPGSVITPVDL